MENIDEITDLGIVDAAFSLEMPDVNNVSVNNVSVNNVSVGDGLKDYTMFIYIGAAILVVFIGVFLYKSYVNKRLNNDNKVMDCEGGFCSMDNKHESTSESTSYI